MRILAAAFALLASLSLAPPVAAEDAKPVDLNREVAACRAIVGTETPPPDAAPDAGPILTNTSALTPATAPGAITVSIRVARCLLDNMGTNLAVFAPTNDPIGIPNALVWPGTGMNREPTPEESKTLAGIFSVLAGGDKRRAILVYCHHVRCGLSYNAIHHLRTAGYTNIVWMREGAAAWEKAGYPLGPIRLKGVLNAPMATARPVPEARDGIRYPVAPGYLAELKRRREQAVPQWGGTFCGHVDHFGQDNLRALPAFRKAARVTPQDSIVQETAKIRQFWQNNIEYLTCSMISQATTLLEYAIAERNYAFINHVIDEWRLPPETLNHIDPTTGRTILDFIQLRLSGDWDPNGYYQETANLQRIFGRWKLAGAMTRDELVQSGAVKPPAQLQADYLARYRAAAQQGDMDAMWYLSETYRRGAHVAADPAEAGKWLDSYGRRIVETSSYDRMLDLGRLYYFSSASQYPGSIPPDGAKAFLWLSRAVAGGGEDANFWMGRAHLDGRGTPNNPAKAIEYFNKTNNLHGAPLKWTATAYFRLGQYDTAAKYMRMMRPIDDIDGTLIMNIWPVIKRSACGPQADGTQRTGGCDG